MDEKERSSIEITPIKRMTSDERIEALAKIFAAWESNGIPVEPDEDDDALVLRSYAEDFPETRANVRKTSDDDAELPSAT